MTTRLDQQQDSMQWLSISEETLFLHDGLMRVTELVELPHDVSTADQQLEQEVVSFDSKSPDELSERLRTICGTQNSANARLLEYRLNALRGFWSAIRGLAFEVQREKAAAREALLKKPCQKETETGSFSTQVSLLLVLPLLQSQSRLDKALCGVTTSLLLKCLRDGSPLSLRKEMSDCLDGLESLLSTWLGETTAADHPVPTSFLDPNQQQNTASALVALACARGSLATFIHTIHLLQGLPDLDPLPVGEVVENLLRTEGGEGQLTALLSGHHVVSWSFDDIIYTSTSKSSQNIKNGATATAEKAGQPFELDRSMTCDGRFFYISNGVAGSVTISVNLLSDGSEFFWVWTNSDKNSKIYLDVFTINGLKEKKVAEKVPLKKSTTSSVVNSSNNHHQPANPIAHVDPVVLPVAPVESSSVAMAPLVEERLEEAVAVCHVKKLPVRQETVIEVEESPACDESVIEIDFFSSSSVSKDTSGQSDSGAATKERAFSNQMYTLMLRDIDEEDGDNPQLVSEYAKDIYNYMMTLESAMPIRQNHLNKQPEVNGRMRCILVDWLIQVHQRVHLLQETLFLTVAILDRYLQMELVAKTKLQLVGVASMWIAAKYEEMYAPEVADFAYITDHAYTKAEIRSMECAILRALDFSFGRPLPIHFLRRFSKAGDCANGHLMCASCLSHLLADARIKGEPASCPQCRCEISKVLCVRNLAVEKAISEMPALCPHCRRQLSRSALTDHRKDLCQERPTLCKYAYIGCPWNGPFRMQHIHELSCAFPKKSGIELLEPVHQIREQKEKEVRVYKQILDLLSCEKVTFLDLQLLPFGTDDFIPKLFYETNRFSAHSFQWTVKARVNDNQDNPIHTMTRTLSYQLVLKTRPQNPVLMSFVALKGPFGETFIDPVSYEFEFSTDTLESPFQEFPLSDSVDCNRMLAAKHINQRMALLQK